MAACALYALNRFWLRERVGGAFLHGYGNDLLLIPAALPLILWVQRRLRLRADDAPPRWSEIAMHLVVWSIAAETIMPWLTARATGDWRDIAAYSAGALVAGFCWQGSAVT